jgi:hypothetical protein
MALFIAVLGVVASALILAAIPALLNFASRRLRAHYRRVMWKSPAANPHVVLPAETDGATPTVRLVKAKDVASSSNIERDEAAAATRDMRIAHGIAALVYAISVVVTILAFLTFHSFATRLGVAYASLAPQLLIVMWALRLARHQRIWAFLIFGATGVVLVLLTSKDALFVMSWSSIVALLIIPALLLLTDRVVEPFVILLLPVLFVIFGVGVFLDLLQPEYTQKGEDVLKGLRFWPILPGLAAVIGGFYLVRALLRRSWPVRLIAAALALIGLVVLNPTNDRQVPGYIGIVGVIGAVVLQMLLIGALFQFLMWLQNRPLLTNELLHVHLAWAWVTLYFELWAWMNDSFIVLRWWFVYAFALSTISLHALLFILRRRRPRVAPKRMLLLRAFGGPDERQDLLDDLRDTWRRVGAIDIIAATDVATRMLRPDMLAAYVLRRTGEQFLSSEAAAEMWLQEHRSTIEGDARYPENPAFCSDDAWQRAFLPLARGADVVLMDVRDFDMTHEGCVFELRTLRDEKRLPRVVFLANERTDRKAIAELLEGHEIKMLDFGRRTDDERRALFDLLLTAAYA